MVIVFSILAGLLIWSGFPPFENPIASILGFSILFRNLLEKDLRVRLLAVFIAALAFFLPLLHWSSSYVGATPWLILSIGQAFIFSALAFISFKRDFISIFGFATAITTIEILRMKAPFGGFGWGRLGHTQIEILGDFYPVFGVAGISFLTSLLAASVMVFPIKTILILFLFLLSAQFLPTPVTTQSINLLAIQGGVDQLGLDYNERAFSVLRRHAALTGASEKPVDLVIWPENAADVDPLKNTQANTIVREAAQRSGTNLLVGAVLQSNFGPQNASILFSETGEIQSTYLKQDLAPFGEYIPLRNLSEFVAPEAREVRDFQPGSQWIWHEVSGAKFVSLICFEILDDDFVRSGVSRAEFAVAQTNNATFGRSSQAAQQLQITRARAAELGRDFAVVSTTGFTAQINRNGEIVSELKQFQPGTLEMKVNTYRDETLAAQIGSWFWIGLMGLVLAVRLRVIFTR